MDGLPIIIGIIAFVLIAVIIFKCMQSGEKFTNTDQGRNFTLKGLTARYGAVPSNPDSAGNNTWATYEQLGELPDKEIPYNVVLPNMMHLPPLRNIYNTPVNEQLIDPISGIPESMYTSPRVQLTDFQSETKRDYEVYN